MKYYIRHNVKETDITNLSDSQSEIIIKEGVVKEEDIIEVEAPNGLFKAQITYISSANVEVEIVKKIGDKVHEGVRITLIQSISNDYKFDFLLEKAVEVGIAEIIPVQSEYSLLDLKKAQKKESAWRQIVNKAVEQSRTPVAPEIKNPVRLQDLNNFQSSKKICLATEPINTKPLTTFNLKPEDKKIVIAVGPEKGWSSNDLEYFKKAGFEFASLKGNILRTETAAIVVATIIRYVNGEL